jgi:hypothetical protein
MELGSLLGSREGMELELGDSEGLLDGDMALVNTSDPMSNNSMARFIMIMVAIDIDGGADE